ncbi:hypothetical protein ES705_36289 [subsurface metagenome]
MISERKRKEWNSRIRFLELVVGPEKLNEWEWNFVTHMEAIRMNEWDLTIKQSFKLGQIFHKYEEKLG